MGKAAAMTKQLEFIINIHPDLFSNLTSIHDQRELKYKTINGASNIGYQFVFCGTVQ